MDKKQFDEGLAQLIANGLLVERDGGIYPTEKGEQWAREKEAETRSRMIADGLMVRVGDTFTLTEKGRQEAEQLAEDTGWVINNSVRLDG